jgi:hypothetical protein
MRFILDVSDRDQRPELIVDIPPFVGKDDFPYGDQPGEYGVERVRGVLAAEGFIAGED